MSDIQGPLSAIANAVARLPRRPPPPDAPLVSMAASGAWLLGWCGYAAVKSPRFLGGDFGALVNAALRSPLDPPLALAIWAGVAAFGLLCLVIGWRAAGWGGRDMGGALGALAWLAGWAVALWREWYFPRGEWGDWVLTVNPLLHGCYIAGIAANAVRFLIAAQLFGGGNALRSINRQIRRNQTVLSRPPRAGRPGLLAAVALAAMIGGGALLWFSL